MKNEELNKIIHELSGLGQSFHSYEQLLLNPSFEINRKKLAEVCGKCARHCQRARQILLENIKEE